jgi:hypothetical protein
MANTPESKVKAKIRKILSTHNCYVTMPIGTGFGSAGVPDYLVCINGHFLGIEAKAGKNKPTALQEKHMAHIRECGGYTIVVNEENFDELDNLLKDLL